MMRLGIQARTRRTHGQHGRGRSLTLSRKCVKLVAELSCACCTTVPQLLSVAFALMSGWEPGKLTCMWMYCDYNQPTLAC